MVRRHSFVCGSGFDFRAVLEGYADVVFAVDCHVVDHRKPVLFAECIKRLPFPQFPEVQFNLLPAGCPLGDKYRHLVVAGFCLVVPCGKPVVTFLVLGLVEGDVGVLADAVLDQFGGDVDLRFQVGKFPFQVIRRESRSKCALEYGDEPLPGTDDRVGCLEKPRFDLLLGQRGRGAFLPVEFVIALPDDLPVGIPL